MMRPLGEAQGRKNQRGLTFVGFGVAVPLFTNKKDSKAKSGYNSGISGCFEALRGAPGVMAW